MSPLTGWNAQPVGSCTAMAVRPVLQCGRHCTVSSMIDTNLMQCGAVLNPTERMDMLWMGKQLPPTPKAVKDLGREYSKLTHGGPSSPSLLAATPPGALAILNTSGQAGRRHVSGWKGVQSDIKACLLRRCYCKQV